MEPSADGFRNYFVSGGAQDARSPAELLVDRAATLTLTVPETTALVGGMRALGATAGGRRPQGVFTRPGTLTNDFFVNLLDMSHEVDEVAGGRKTASTKGAIARANKLKWTATPVDCSSAPTPSCARNRRGLRAVRRGARALRPRVREGVGRRSQTLNRFDLVTKGRDC